MPGKDEIKKEGIKIIEEFSMMLSDIPETSETHYVVELKNVWRADGKPADCEGFRKKFLANAPETKDGFLIDPKQ